MEMQHVQLVQIGLLPSQGVLVLRDLQIITQVGLQAGTAGGFAVDVSLLGPLIFP